MRPRKHSIFLKRRLLTFVAFDGAVGVAALALTVTGAPLERASIGSLLFGSCGLALLFAVAEIVAPGPFMRWRAWMMADDPPLFRQVGGAFDQFLGTDGDEAWRKPRARRQVRIFGMVLFVIGLAITLFLWWILRSGGLI